MSEAVKVEVDRLRRLDLAFQAAECGLGDAFAIQARRLEGRTLADLEVMPGGVRLLVKLQKMIAYLGEARKAAKARADELEVAEEARRA